MTTCHVTLPTAPRTRSKGSPPVPVCGKPAVKYGLCQRHYADRIRLGGAE